MFFIKLSWVVIQKHKAQFIIATTKPIDGCLLILRKSWVSFSQVRLPALLAFVLPSAVHVAGHVPLDLAFPALVLELKPPHPLHIGIPGAGNGVLLLSEEVGQLPGRKSAINVPTEPIRMQNPTVTTHLLLFSTTRQDRRFVVLRLIFF